MRAYERSHPWITFRFSTERLSQRTLMLIGEAHSKCSHIAGVPLTPAVADELHRIYLAKGIAGTTAIEGNTLTEAQVKEAIQGTLDLPPSQRYLQQEIENIAQACTEIGQKVLQGQTRLTADWVKHLNRLVLRDLPKEEHVAPGEIRGYAVGVLRYPGAPHEDCAHLLDRMCHWLEEWPTAAWGEGTEIPTAVLKAILAHLYIAWIHPFGDGNGRTARLLEYYILADAGVPSPAAHLLSNHYNLTRSEYYRHLDRANKNEHGVAEFIEYALRGFVDELHKTLIVIRQQQWLMTWRDYVHDVFRGRRSSSDSRQRELLLALQLRAGEAVSRKELIELTPDLVRWYSKKSERTLSRDINALVASGLVVKTQEGYRARLEIVMAFLPPRKPSEHELQEIRRIVKEVGSPQPQLSLFNADGE